MRWCPGKAALVLACAFSALDPAPSVRAEPESGFVFQWLAPEGCPSLGAVETEIETLLGGPAKDRVHDELRVQASVLHGELWLVTLETASKTTSGHRTIEAASCQGLANATALIVALMIDPDAVAARTGKKTSEPPPTAKPAATPPPSTAADAPALGATRVLVGIGAALNVGVLPSPDVGIGAGIGIARPSWRMELRAAYGPHSVASDPLSAPADAYGRFRLLAGTLAGCVTVSRPAMVWGPCVDVEFGVVHGEGIGATQTNSENAAWLGVGTGGIVAFRVNSWLFVPVHADIVVPLWRPRFMFQNVDSPIFRAWPVGGRMTAGVEVHF
jgi:hypothetical protein